VRAPWPNIRVGCPTNNILRSIERGRRNAANRRRIV
jgi:hypothetical protein